MSLPKTRFYVNDNSCNTLLPPESVWGIHVLNIGGEIGGSLVDIAWNNALKRVKQFLPHTSFNPINYGFILYFCLLQFNGVYILEEVFKSYIYLPL